MTAPPAMLVDWSLWAPRVRRWARRWTDAAHAEDAAQEVLLLAMDRRPDNLGAWLYGATWRTVRAQQRRAWVRRRGEVDLEAVRAPDCGRETARDVRRVMAAMPGPERDVLWLAYAEGATRAEIAAALDQPVGTINRRLTRARRTFSTLAREAGLAALLMLGLAMCGSTPFAPVDTSICEFPEEADLSVCEPTYLDELPGVCLQDA